MSKRRLKYKERAITGLIYVLIVLFSLFYDPLKNSLPFFLFTFIITILGNYEFYYITEKVGNKPYITIGLILSAMFSTGIYIYGIDFFSFILPLSVITVLIASFLIKFEDRNAIDSFITLAGLYYFPLINLGVLIHKMENGKFLLLLVFLGTWAYDTFAYLIGSKFGKVKLAPKISPLKTIEGVIGGFIGVFVAILLIGGLLNFILTSIWGYGIFNLPLNLILIYCIFISIFAQIGDLSESYIKRKFFIKDSGSIFPGHGGVLDRCDSLLFTIIMSYWFFNFFIT